MDTKTDNDKAEIQASAKTIPPLNSAERRVILKKGTERAFSGKYWNHFEPGTYSCRKCGTGLYVSKSKFASECGWPSFDDEIDGAIQRLMDPDGYRTEIRCSSCDGHLGHVFLGERLTDTNTRHCVNSLSIVFTPNEDVKTERAIFAGGCFWGVEHQFEQIDGVTRATSGYIGGKKQRPTYRDVTTGRTYHAEAVEIHFNPDKVSYEELAKRFFEIHDPTQRNRQGPDVGTQYRSAVFVTSDEQRVTIQKLIGLLDDNGYNVVTKVVSAPEFWPAEVYHQNYIKKHPNVRCHLPVARFDKKK